MASLGEMFGTGAPATSMGPLAILQVDAHIDWRDEVEEKRWSLSSTMRRASEMTHVGRIGQVGSRGMGGARPLDVADALAWGATLVPAVRPDPAEAALAAIPEGARIALCLDWDALDPSEMPAVIAPTAGGLRYGQVLALVAGACAKGRVAAVSTTELMASRDRGGLGAGLAAQAVPATLGLLARAP